MGSGRGVWGQEGGMGLRREIWGLGGGDGVREGDMGSGRGDMGPDRRIWSHKETPHITHA